MASPSPGTRSPLRVAGIALLGIGAAAAFAGLISTTQGDGTGTVAQAPTSSAGVLAPSGQAALPADPAVVNPPADANGGPAEPTTPFVSGPTADGSTGEDTASGSAPGSAPAPAPAAAPGQPPAIAAPAPAGVAAAGGPAAGGAAAGGPAAGGAAAGAAAAGGGGAQPPAGGQPVVREPLRVYNNSRVPGLAARAAESFKSAGWAVNDIGGYKGRLLESAAYYRPGTSEEAAAKQLAADFGLAAKPRFPEIQRAHPGVIVILIKDYAATGKS